MKEPPKFETEDFSFIIDPENSHHPVKKHVRSTLKIEDATVFENEMAIAKYICNSINSFHEREETKKPHLQFYRCSFVPKYSNILFYSLPGFTVLSGGYELCSTLPMNINEHNYFVSGFKGQKIFSKDHFPFKIELDEDSCGKILFYEENVPCHPTSP